MIVRDRIRVIFEIFLKFTSRLVPEGWVELKKSGCRYYFWTFQLELNILSTKNIEIGSVGTKLQLFEVGWFLEFLMNFCSENTTDFLSKTNGLILYYPNRFKVKIAGYFCPGSYCFQKISACGGRNLLFVLVLTLCLPLKANKKSACGRLIFGGVLFSWRSQRKIDPGFYRGGGGGGGVITWHCINCP